MKLEFTNILFVGNLCSNMSIKWISTDSSKLQANPKADAVFSKLQKEKCNFISIFGRARQGKSFLMNCLSGERDTFKISNEKESVSNYTCDLSIVSQFLMFGVVHSRN